MSMIPECLICNQPMELIKFITAKKRRLTKPKALSGIKRYKCDLCNYATTIYANGVRDLIDVPLAAQNEVKKIYKKEEQNRIK